MGDVCTRDCGFCGVRHGYPGPLDPQEPENLAGAVACLGLGHVVITSVTRDDLVDGGAAHYSATIRAVRSRVPEATVEVLTPDFLGRSDDLDVVLGEAPEVFGHNIETIPRLYASVRPQAAFSRSVAVLRNAASYGSVAVKTGWMIGLGEKADEVRALFDEVAASGVDMVTIGQYLRPSKNHVPVVQYVHPDVFEQYREWGEALGLQVQLVRLYGVRFRPMRVLPVLPNAIQAEDAFVLIGRITVAKMSGCNLCILHLSPSYNRSDHWRTD
jgi:lipoic acid synthetase